MGNKEKREIPPQVQEVISGIKRVGLTEASTLHVMGVAEGREGVVMDLIIGTDGCYKRAMGEKLDALRAEIAAPEGQGLTIIRMMPNSFLAQREGSVLNQPVPNFSIILTPENLKPC